MLQQNIILKFLILGSKLIFLVPNLAIAANHENYIYKCVANGKTIGYYDKPCEYIPKLANFHNVEEVTMRSTVYFANKKNRQRGKNNHQNNDQNSITKNSNCSCNLNSKRCITVTAKIFLLNKIIKDLNKDLNSQLATQSSVQSQQLFINKLKKYLTKYNQLKIKYCSK